VRSLDGIGIGISGLEVRTPTLDDVFFTLTGRHVEPEDEPEEVAA
jgi:oleandomycin transport system ATP-binding protein